MLTAIGAALALAGEVMKYVNTEKSRQLINDVKDIKLKLLEEEGKGYYSDDAKIETLEQQAKILVEACTAEFQLHAASK